MSFPIRKIGFLWIVFLIASSAMEPIEETSSAHQNDPQKILLPDNGRLPVPKLYKMTPVKQYKVNLKQPNVNEDVPGCMDDYYRCWITGWRIADPCLPPLKIMLAIAGTALTATLAWNTLSSEAKTAIGIAGVICTALIGGLQSCAQSSPQAKKDAQDELAEIVIEQSSLDSRFPEVQSADPQGNL